ncbi:mycothiol synthase [Corynebacterium pseudodiphtheriticum]|uniref:mycothiol synthase n=1 Tax=Corynebacterium pseudodiphtheriticum TaxID=37637 RepID=UPI00254DE8EE|nr:mycothiol synthase [Corynebacterium pseudodiphtheriticum]MDK8478229.1 mycothiol synthase [Corynebacterium pseudodiphtheriticum]MDK8500431.1 mycothiol synthase [Corynebacterium pseudodiphtheriticum]MDK8583965.1 mycothiol synthase [Corynebacterium pseudodiphtheriticum]MDK8839366.1 mycothiol synthase [Corynebacterium pseudodiphtheriticum]
MANCDRLRFLHTILADASRAQADLAGSGEPSGEHLVTATRRAAEQILQAAEAADGFAPLSEQFVAGLSDQRVGQQQVLAFLDDELVGLAGLDGWQPGSAGDADGDARGDVNAEMVIAPSHRGQGFGTCLYRHLRELVGTSLQVWAHGQLPAAEAIAHKQQLEIVRHLLVMSVTGEALQKSAEPGATPAGFVAANYPESVERFGTEHVENSWVEANNQAFSWHPEQGGWDRDRLHRSMEAEWFDPQDVILLWDNDAAVGVDKHPALAGFHWTKWHGAAEDSAEAVGEVYVIGLASAYQGRGLSGHLLRLGIKQMVNKGATEVILYVEKDNESAVRVYEKSGFDIAENHVVYAANSGNGVEN